MSCHQSGWGYFDTSGLYLSALRKNLSLSPSLLTYVSKFNIDQFEGLKAGLGLDLNLLKGFSRLFG